MTKEIANVFRVQDLFNIFAFRRGDFDGFVLQQLLTRF